MPNTTTPTFWAAPFQVNTSTLGSQTDSTVLALSDGGFMVAWVNTDPALSSDGSTSVVMQRFDNAGQRVGEEIIVDVASTQYFPQLVELAYGHIGLVQSVSGSTPYTMLTEYTVWGGYVGTLWSASSSTDPSSVTALQNGATATVFLDSSGALVGQYCNRLGYTTTFTVADAPSGNDISPHVTALANGGFVVTWDDNANSQINYRVFTANGEGIGADQTFSLPLGFGMYPQVTGLANGNFVITATTDLIYGSDMSYSVVYMVCSPSGVPLTQSAVVNSTVTGTQTQCVTVALDDGFMAVWIDASYSVDHADGIAIRGQRFDGVGNRIGQEFLVADLGGSQTDAAIAALADGRVVVTFTDNSGWLDPDAGGIAAVILDPREATIVGTNGNDVIHGRLGDSVIEGLDGSDELTGMNGDDIVRGGSGSDILSGGGGDDQIDGGSGHDLINGGQGYNEIDAGSGDDTVSTGGGTDRVILGSGADYAITGNGNDYIEGGIGNDTLNGGLGADYLEGGADNDTYVVNTLDDQVVEAAASGNDTVRALNVSWTLGLNVENLVLVTGNVNGTGNTQANAITGSAGTNILKGLAGNDVLRGAGGDDRLEGGSGADTLVGGTGKDTLVGGTENDVFKFLALGDSTAGVTNADVISDFSHSAGDRIDLAAIDAITGGADDAFSFIGTAQFGNIAGQLRYRLDGAGNTIVSCDVNGDGAADMSIVLTGEITLTADDFAL